MNGFDILALVFSVLSSLVLGYYLGQGKKPKEVYDDIAHIGREIKKRRTPVGAVNRPSAEKVILWSTPEKEEQDEAFKASFKKDIGDPTI